MSGSILAGRTTTGAGDAVPMSGAKHTFQGTVTGTGAVSATVLVEVSNDGASWLTMGTLTLSGTTSATDGFASDSPWELVRANVTAISGTGAAVTVVAN